MKRLVKNNIYWVGKIDWELRKFHGEEYSTHRGSSYNSYLVQEEKTVLIDTVWLPYAKEYVANLASEIDLDKIDYIVINHGELDHSGALPELMSHIPKTPIYCTANAVKSLKGHYHQDWDFRVVKTGDQLPIGNGKALTFIEARMLHWPDTMMTYLSEDNVLFSSDIFGQHYASELMFNDRVDQAELFAEAIKYYANIINPFSPLVPKKLDELVALGMPIDIFCTSHGVIWRDNIGQIVEKYRQWSNQYQENQIVIVYDTMWSSTRLMGESIARGIAYTDPSVVVKLFNLAHSDKNDVMTEIFRSKTVCVGSSTINNGMLSSVVAVLEEMKGLGFKNKKAVGFGSYGWSGESVKEINEGLQKSGLALINEGLRVNWVPDADALQKCFDLGIDIATA